MTTDISFKQTDTGRILELSERPDPPASPSNWKQPMPVDQRLRNSSWKNHVILAHREGSDYSVVSLCQKCHDISMLGAVKPTSFHCLLQERVRGNRLARVPGCSWPAFSTAPGYSLTSPQQGPTPLLLSTTVNKRCICWLPRC